MAVPKSVKKTIAISKKIAEYEYLFGPSADSRPSSGVWILLTSASDYVRSIAVPNSSVAHLQLE
eukprot:9157898-Pyramimonas_sp.AAC.1